MGLVTRLIAHLFFLLVMALSTTAICQTEQQVRHEQHKEAAYAAFEVGRYDEAIDQFEQAYRIKRDPRLLYNIGLAYYRRHELRGSPSDLRQARNLFRRFLQLVPPPEADAPDRQKVRDARRYARQYVKRLESLPIQPQTQPATLPSSMPSSLPSSLPAAARHEPDLRAAQPDPATARVQEKPGPSPAHWLLYALAGASGAAAAVTGGLALRADHNSDDLARLGDSGANAEADRSRNLALATDVLIGAAVVSAVTAVVLHLRSR